MIELIQNTFFFIVFIGTLVFVHELGHFLVAKACDVKVTSFSLGFGPRLLSFSRGETEYKLSALPLGGYVKMVGELPGVELAPEDVARALSSKPIWQRVAVVAAGPIANFVFAFFVYLFMFSGLHTFNDTRLGIVSVGDPAWNGGLRPGDKITEVNGNVVARWEDLAQAVGSRPAERITIGYERSGKSYETDLVTAARSETNIFGEVESRGKIGISLNYVESRIAVTDVESPAARAGLQTDDVVVAIGSTAVSAWHEVRNEMARVPEGQSVDVRVKRDTRDLTFSLIPDDPVEGLDAALFSAADTKWGYTGVVSRDVILDTVEEDTPAAQAGLKVGDRLLALSMRGEDGADIERPIGVWGMDLAAFQGADARNEFVLTVQRGRQVFPVALKLFATEEKDDFKNVTTRYVFGARNSPNTLAAYTYERTVGAFEATGQAAWQVWADMSLIGVGLYKLIRGVVPLESMGGPIMLFVIAEKSAKRGLDHFLRMLAIISVNLGLLNLLPIPVLDGGHLVFFGVEAIRRRPPSIRFREVTNLVGIVLLLLLMVLVFSNDIMRFVIG